MIITFPVEKFFKKINFILLAFTKFLMIFVSRINNQSFYRRKLSHDFAKDLENLEIVGCGRLQLRFPFDVKLQAENGHWSGRPLEVLKYRSMFVAGVSKKYTKLINHYSTL